MEIQKFIVTLSPSHILEKITLREIQKSQIGSSEIHCDTESISQFRVNNSQGNGFGHYVHENIIPGQNRFQETMESYTSEFKMTLSQQMHGVHDAFSD